jgi:hypothetical protein
VKYYVERRSQPNWIESQTITAALALKLGFTAFPQKEKPNGVHLLRFTAADVTFFGIALQPSGIKDLTAKNPVAYTLPEDQYLREISEHGQVRRSPGATTPTPN